MGYPGFCNLYNNRISPRIADFDVDGYTGFRDAVFSYGDDATYDIIVRTDISEGEYAVCASVAVVYSSCNMVYILDKEIDDRGCAFALCDEGNNNYAFYGTLYNNSEREEV